MNSISEALAAALLAAGEGLPVTDESRHGEKVVVQVGKTGKIHAVTVTYGESQYQRSRDKSPKRKMHGTVGAPMFIAPIQNISLGSKANNDFATKPMPSPIATPIIPKAKPKPLPPFSLDLSAEARCLLSARKSLCHPLIERMETAGTMEQCHAAVIDDEREVCIGLDFGTSCSKVVIGDAALSKAFAVPFCQDGGLGAYLLPSRLDQALEVFSLESGEQTHRDLKLDFLAHPDSLIHQARVAAYLALVIRRARGWLFTQHKLLYGRTKIFWKLAIGLPTSSSLEIEMSRRFEKIAAVAWALAASSEKLTESMVTNALVAAGNANGQEVSAEVSVVPEIAAQIYGFVVSQSFDKKAPNNYLMVDVGAGTIDSSLFHVKPARGGRWDFEFFTSVVEPNGVTNLHRVRVDWWAQTLRQNGATDALINEVLLGKFDADRQAPLPESFTDYFSGLSVDFREGVETPDEEFFDKRVVDQVRGKTLWRTWKDEFMDQSALTGIPMFLCGGGARMRYYQGIKSELAAKPGYRWLQADPRVMGFPEDLEADGLDLADYDRMSVAYGLSQLEVGKIVRALPPPKIQTAQISNWGDRYIDKDQC